MSQVISRLYMAPLLSHNDAKQALRRFASGKINAQQLQARLDAVARVTHTSPATVREFVYRAICAKFGLPTGQGGADA